MSAPDALVQPLELGALTRRRRARVPLLIWACFAVVAVVLVAALFGQALAPEDASAQDLLVGVAPPGAAGLLGTDDLGRDVLSRLIVGARMSLLGPLAVAVGALLLGGGLGLLAGYRGGWIDATIMRWVDLQMAVPPLLVAVVVTGVLGGGYTLTAAVMTVLFAPNDARLVRGAALAQRNLPYIEAVRAMGLRSGRIMARHVWPNVLPIALANTFLTFAFALVIFSGLSFLGIGSGPESSDWGRMLTEGRVLMYENPAMVFGPALAIVLTAASVNLIGDWIYERLAEEER